MMDENPSGVTGDSVGAGMPGGASTTNTNLGSVASAPAPNANPSAPVPSSNTGAAANTSIGTSTLVTSDAEASAAIAQDAPTGRKKKTLFITLIVTLVALVCCGVVAWIIISNPLSGGEKSQQDFTVMSSEQMEEIASELAQKYNIAIEGDVIMTQPQSSATVNIDFEGLISKDGLFSVALTFMPKIATGVDDVANSVKAKMVGTRDKIYFMTLPTDSGNWSDKMSGSWYLLPIQSVGDMLGTASGNSAQCLIDAASLQNSASVITESYQNYPFFIVTSSSTDMITDDTLEIYSLKLDADKLYSFVDEISETKAFKDVTQCLGVDATATSALLSEQDLEEFRASINALPEVFLGIDGNDIRQITLDYNEGSSGASLKVNIKLSYPEDAKIEVPTEYTNLEEILDGASLNSDSKE